jgi:cobalamin synthase
LTPAAGFATRAPVAIADEMRAAAGAVFGLGALGRDLPREAQVGGLVFYPLVGAGVGGAAAVAAAAMARIGPLAAGVAAVGVLACASGGGILATLVRAWRGTTPSVRSVTGITLAVAVVLTKIWAVSRLPDGGRAVGLVLAAMLGRWAVVVQCYGGTAAPGSGPAGQVVGRARLREFGWASAAAFATTLAALDAIGLVVLLAATLTTIAIRLAAYRRAGGVSGAVLGVSLELVEAVVLLVLAALARR